MAVSTKVKDPVCGMTIDASSAAGTSECEGETYYFCSPVCKEKFDANPAQFVASEENEKAAPVAPSNGLTAESNGKDNGSLKNADVMSGRRNDHSQPFGAGERVDLPITGMTCAACANRIEKQLNKQAGVEKASVNFATSRATVSYDPEKTGVGNLIQTVKDVGYDTAGTQTVEFVVDDSARDLAMRVKAETGLPLALGFGISRPEHVRAIGACADAAVVGSALVNVIAEHGKSPALLDEVERYVRWLRN